MKRVAAQVAEHEPRIDVLINNAGALFATRRLTELSSTSISQRKMRSMSSGQ